MRKARNKFSVIYSQNNIMSCCHPSPVLIFKTQRKKNLQLITENYHLSSCVSWFTPQSDQTKHLGEVCGLRYRPRRNASSTPFVHVHTEETGAAHERGNTQQVKLEPTHVSLVQLQPRHLLYSLLVSQSTNFVRCVIYRMNKTFTWGFFPLLQNSPFSCHHICEVTGNAPRGTLT